MEIRHDWARDEIHRIYHLPLPELMFRAQLVDDIPGPCCSHFRKETKRNEAAILPAFL